MPNNREFDRMVRQLNPEQQREFGRNVRIWKTSHNHEEKRRAAITLVGIAFLIGGLIDLYKGLKADGIVVPYHEFRGWVRAFMEETEPATVLEALDKSRLIKG